MYKSQYLLVAVLLLFADGSAMGGTIISTFGPGDSYSACCAWGVVAPLQLAYPFVIPSGLSFIFTGAALALSQGIGSTNAVDISLAADASDQPGTVLETFHLENALGPAGANNPPIVVNSVLDPLLLADSQYWLIEAPSISGNGVNWVSAFIAPNPPQRATRNGAGSWTVSATDSFNSPGAFSISGAPVSIPEPSYMSLVGTLLLMLGWQVRQTHKNTGNRL